MLRNVRFPASLGLAVALGAIGTSAGAQQALLLGTVLADSAERPLVNAEVAIPALNVSTLTDSAGTFALGRLPAGTYQVVVRAVGRVPYRETVTFGATDRIERDFLLKRAVNTLAKVEVLAAGAPVDMRLAAYEERRRLGHGKFLTQDVLAKAEGRKLADVLRSHVAGLRPVAVGSVNAIVSTRGPMRNMPAGDDFDARQGARPQCYVQVIVDGVIRYRSQRGEKLFDINSIAPDHLAGVEYYTSATTPPQYNATGATCGTLILWTRMQ